MRKGSRVPGRVAMVVTLALLAACGSSGEVELGDRPTTTGDSSGGNESPTAAGAVASLEDVETAVVKIVGQGSFRDPDLGMQLDVAGAGSGFIIDESGLAVTNNHVVTGAATLQVLVWEDGQLVSRNAQVVAASECWDLALIDISGEGYPFLTWFDDEIKVGLDVYAAGFPDFENEEFTLTRGIVSKARSVGATSWASVDAEIQHDARIVGGNSGGPLVDADGKVLAVNYAGGEDSSENFAIAADGAQDVVERLSKGEPYEWLGVNGQAVYDPGADLSGIWVAGVETGSPADEVGLVPGDIIVALQGLGMALDGSMEDYCDVLRTAGSGNPLRVEVLRWDTEEYLEGTFFGSPLEASFSFAQEFGDDDEPTTPGSGFDYVSVTDDLGRISVDVPAGWSFVDGTPDPEDGAPRLVAAQSAEFVDSWDVSGLQIDLFAAEYGFTADTLLDTYIEISGCASLGREPYEDVLYVGAFEVLDCSPNAETLVVVAGPPGDGYLIAVLFQAATASDLEALDVALNTFVAS